MRGRKWVEFIIHLDRSGTNKAILRIPEPVNRSQVEAIEKFTAVLKTLDWNA